MPAPYERLPAPGHLRAEVMYELPATRIVATPSAVRVLAWSVGVMTAVFVAILIFSPWQQNVPGAGRVTAFAPEERQQSIDAPVDGRVVKWYVQEGSRVSTGDKVVDIADIDPLLPMRLQNERDAVLQRIRAATDRERQIETRIFEMEQSLRSELAAADFRIQQADDRIRAAEQAVQAAEAKEIAARQNFDRLQILFPRGLVSKRQVEVAEAELNGAIADSRRASAQMDEARNSMKAAEAERERALNSGTAVISDARAALGSARSETASARQSLQQIEGRLGRQLTQTVTAPSGGTIFRLIKQPGSAVIRAGEEVASFVPDASAPVVELWVHGNDLPLISPGRHVRLQFEGWPAVQFVGWPSVAVGTFGGLVTLIDQTDNRRGEFRILVSPDPGDSPWPSPVYLRQGVRTKGWVLLEMVPLWFEIWRQLNGFPPSVSDDPMRQITVGTE